MAAASSYSKDSPISGLGMGLGLLVLVAFGAATGAMIALGEMQALYVSLTLLACLGVLYDFRVGAVLLIILLPFSASSVFPHELMGMRGLNPINLLVLGTLGSFLLHGGIGQEVSKLLPKPLLYLYLLPFVAAGLLGTRHVDDIFPYFHEMQAIDFTTAASYLRDMLLKPMLIVVVAVLIAAAVVKAQKPERFLMPIVASIWVVCLVMILFVAASDLRLGQLATTAGRRTFIEIGMHANDLGRLFLMAYALMLFTWWETKEPRFKLVLFFTLGIISLAILLTFSRGAFTGFMLVNALFLMWKFNAKTLSLALLGATVLAAFAPGYLYRRVMVGFETGSVDAVSAGRVEGIWMPLLPEIWKSPLWGNGLGSVMWSDAMVTEAMIPVTHPHNAFFEATLDAGFIGLALLLAFYWTVYKGFRSLGSHAYLSPEMRGFFQGATVGLVAFFVTGWAGSTLMPRYEWVFLWMAIGMMYGMLARRPAS